MSQSLTIANPTLSSALTRGLNALASGNWPTPGVDEFLATLALRLVVCGYLVGEVRRVEVDGHTQIQVTLDDRPVPEERRRAAKILLAPLAVYLELADLKVTTAPSLVDTGAIPVPIIIAAGVVSVAIVAGGAYVITYVASEAAKVVDGALRRNAAAKEVQSADEQAIKVMNAHVQRDIAQGRLFEFDEAERAVLNALQDRVSNIVKQAYTPIDSNKGLPAWALPALGIAGAAAVSALFFIRR